MTNDFNSPATKAESEVDPEVTGTPTSVQEAAAAVAYPNQGLMDEFGHLATDRELILALWAALVEARRDTERLCRAAYNLGVQDETDAIASASFDEFTMDRVRAEADTHA